MEQVMNTVVVLCIGLILGVVITIYAIKVGVRLVQKPEVEEVLSPADEKQTDNYFEGEETPDEGEEV